MHLVGVVAVDQDRLEAVRGRPVGRRVLDRGHVADRACTPCRGCSRRRRRPAASRRRPGSAPRGTPRCSWSRRRRSRRRPDRCRAPAPPTPRPPRSACARRRSRRSPSRRARRRSGASTRPCRRRSPVARPSSSAISPPIGAPRSSVWTWPRYVQNTRSFGSQRGGEPGGHRLLAERRGARSPSRGPRGTGRAPASRTGAPPASSGRCRAGRPGPTASPSPSSLAPSSARVQISTRSRPSALRTGTA